MLSLDATELQLMISIWAQKLKVSAGFFLGIALLGGVAQLRAQENYFVTYSH